jgi:hypothetical protein
MTVLDDLLDSDFEECFEQMRHYDSAFESAVQFAYTGTVTVAGASGTLLQAYGPDSLILAIVSFILVFSCLAGLVVVLSLARNRVYFAKVARYVNEIRGFNLHHHPARIENKAQMYTEWRFPPIFDLFSTQSLHVYLVSAFDSILFASAVVALIAWRDIVNRVEPLSVGWSWGIVSCVACLLTELVFITLYWHREESKTGSGLV